jgi:hypothetical protein
MAVRRNPDWSVWLADVWHWARQPPGIYICIIAVLGCALWYSVSGPAPRIALTTPSPPATTQRTPQSAIHCPPGYGYIPELGECGPIVAPKSTTNCPSGMTYYPRGGYCVVLTPGTQNNCDWDQIFITSLNGCIEIASRAYYMFAGTSFKLTATTPSTIQITQGAGSVTDAFTSQVRFVNAGQSININSASEFRASVDSRVTVTFR